MIQNGHEVPSTIPQTRTLMSNHIDVWELFGIYIVTTILTVLTLGIYRFWGKTRIRRYLWGSQEILGDRLEYTGTGMELFKGFLVVFILILLPLVVVNILVEEWLLSQDEMFSLIYAVVQITAVLFLIGVAVFRARRYRLTRSHWRGIYGGQTGSAIKYGLMSLAAMLANVLSLGLAMPLTSLWMRRYEMAHTWIGDEQPVFAPSAKALYASFWVPWVVGVGVAAIFAGVSMSTLGVFGAESSEPTPEEMAAALDGLIGAYLLFIPMMLALFWYRGRMYSHFVSATSFHGHCLISRISGLGFMWLMVSNMLLVVVTLGFGVPFTYSRVLDYLERNVHLMGSGDFSGLMQSTQEKPTRGEGLADAFDIGAI